MTIGKALAAIAALFLLGLGITVNAQTFDKYGGYTGLKGSNTSGFFRTEKIDGRYWLITPDNNVMWSTGICVIQFNDTWGGHAPTTKQYPNPYSNKAKYPGGIDSWARTMNHRMDNWGFNTSACWSSPSIVDRSECFRDLGLNSRAISAGCRVVAGNFPDVWDPIWETTCQSTADSMLTPNKTNPWTMGSFVCNEVNWTNPPRCKTLPDGFIALPATASGKLQWVNVFLKSKYADIATLNAAYGKNYASFDELLSITSLPDDSAHPAILSDKIDFMEAIADRFYSVATLYMRKYDPNHLVFSTRWAMWGEGFAHAYTRPFNERIWKKAGQYCDVFANNGYADFASAEALYQHSTRVYQNAKKPFMVTEHAALANDSYFAQNQWWVPTQMDRGNWYYGQVKALLDMGVDDDPNDPGHPAKTCMGLHWFQCYDEPSLGRPDGEKAQFGVFNVQDEAFLPFVEMAKTTNSQIYEHAIHNTDFDIPNAPTAVSPVSKASQDGERASSYKRILYATQLLHVFGSQVDDPDATQGTAWKGSITDEKAGDYLICGPYATPTTMLQGVKCTVTYRLKVADNTSTEPVAGIDCATLSGRNFWFNKTFKGTDFKAPNTYQDFSETFTTPNPGQDQWEFRVHLKGKTDLYVDTVTLTMQPTETYVLGPLSDGKDATLWQSADHDAADAIEWASVYLGKSMVPVSRLSVTSGSVTPAGLPVDFQLQYSADGIDWTAIPGQTYNGYVGRPGANDFSFQPVNCRYLRLYATKLGQDTDSKYRLILGAIEVIPKTKTATPTFAWKYSEPAQSYTLLMSPIAHFPEEQTIKVEGITKTNYTPTVPLAQGIWYWTVKAINASKHEGRYSTTSKFEIGDLPGSQFDPTTALKCEQMPNWKNMNNHDTGGDGYSFAFLDTSIKDEGHSSLRVAITVNSLNKTTGMRNMSANAIPFSYAGPKLDFSGMDNFTFRIYPKRFCDADAEIVSSTKYLNFRMIDQSGAVVADRAIDPDGSLARNQWSTITIPLSGKRSQVTKIEFYVKSNAPKLTFDERVFFNIDNLSSPK